MFVQCISLREKQQQQKTVFYRITAEMSENSGLEVSAAPYNSTQ